MRLCRPHFSNFADLFSVLGVLVRLFEVLLGALGGHKIRLKPNSAAQGGAPGPPAGPGKLPVTFFKGWEQFSDDFGNGFLGSPQDCQDWI